MKLLKPSDRARLRHFRTGCAVCAAEFTFCSTDKGVNIEHKGPGEDWLHLNCPGCNTRIAHRLPQPALVELAPAAAATAP